MKKYEIQRQARIVQEVLREDYNCPLYAAELVECLLRGAAQEIEANGIEVLAMYIVQGGQEVIIQMHKKDWLIQVPASVFECRINELVG